MTSLMPRYARLFQLVGAGWPPQVFVYFVEIGDAGGLDFGPGGGERDRQDQYGNYFLVMH
jgi:hypothetical protein